MRVNSDYDAQIDSAGKYYNVDPGLIKTVFHVESGGNPNAPRGSSGEIGSFQFMPETARRLGMSDPTDFSQAIPAAARLLAEGLDKTGSAAGALGYYNSGRTGVVPQSTVGYVNKALQMYPSMKIEPNNRPKQKGDDLEGSNPSDPYVQSGKQLYQQLTGEAPPDEPKPEHKSNSIDISSNPYLDRGKELFKSITGRDPDNPDNATQEPGHINEPAMTPPGPGPQPGQPAPQAQAEPQAEPGILENLGHGFVKGAKDVYDATAGLVNRVDNASPWLSALDSLHGFTPERRAQTMQDIQSSDQQYNQRYGDQPLASVGRAGGNIAATLPFGGVAGKAILGAGEAAGVAPWIARLAAGATQGAVGSGMTGQDPLIGAATGGAISGAANLAGPLATGLQKTAAAAKSPLGQAVLGNTTGLIAGIGGHMYGGPAHAIAGGYLGSKVGEMLKGVAAKYGEEFAKKVADAVRQNPELINQLNIPTILTSANKAAGFQLEE